MKVSSEHKAELSFMIPDGVHVESRLEFDEHEVARNMMRIWSRSAIHESVAKQNIEYTLEAFREALEEK